MAGKAKLNPKQLLINHGEKGVFGLAVAIVLFALGTTNWSPYERSPDEITKKVADAKANLAVEKWPDEEKAHFKLTEDQLPVNVVDRNLKQEVAVAPFEFPVKIKRSIFDGKDPRKEPKLFTLEDPIAMAGRVLIEKAPKVEETEGEEAEGAEGTEKKDADALEGINLDEIPEEFRDQFRKRAAGLAASGMAGGAAGALNDGGTMSSSEMYYPPDLMQQMLPDSTQMLSGEGGLYGPGDMTMAMQKPEVEAEGRHYVSVRMVFPVKDQIFAFADAIGGRSISEGARSFEIIDFELERQTMQPGNDPWSGAWTPVDIQVAKDVLETCAGFDPDVVQGTVTDSTITMPLPVRVTGSWKDHASHPRIEKFTLSEAEMQKELELNKRLLMKFMEQKGPTSDAPVAKRGFSDVQYDNRRLTASAMGMEGDFGAYGMSSMGMSMGMGAPGMGGMSMANPYGGGTRGGNTPLEKLAADLTKAGGNKDDKGAGKETDAALKQWIIDRVRVEGELLLFRYLDFDVTPGKGYRYRARLVLRNPNYGFKISEADGIPTVVQGDTRTTEWSEPTAGRIVPSDVHYFVDRIDELRGGAVVQAVVKMFQWDDKFGTVVSNNVNVRFGQMIGDLVKTNVIKPAKSTAEEEAYQFHSSDTLVDVLADISLSANDHPGLELPSGSRGDMLLPEQLLVVSSDRVFEVVDPVAQAQNRKVYQTMFDFQATQFKSFTEEPELAADDLGGLYSGMAGSAEMMGMGSMSMMGGSQGKSPLRKKSGSGGGRRSSRPPMMNAP